jgi:hypothetical protein
MTMPLQSVQFNVTDRPTQMGGAKKRVRRPATSKIRRGGAGLRRGSIYIFVLFASMLLVVVGLSTIAVARLQERQTGMGNDGVQAEVLAESAVEFALTKLAADPNWRTTYTGNVETTPVPCGPGTISFKLVDEIDANLSDAPADPVRVYGFGRVGTATRVYSVLLQGKWGLDVLRTAIHAGGPMTVVQGSLPEITVLGGPLSSNGNLSNSGTITGNVEAASVSNSGSIAGQITAPAAAKIMPPANLFPDYVARATQIPYSKFSSNNTLQHALLAPGRNPYGTTNPDGAYYISVPAGTTFYIYQARVYGTLVIDLGAGATLCLYDRFVMEPSRSDYPLLIVRCAGAGEKIYIWGGSSLSEGDGVNYNPPGLPCWGYSNNNTWDVFPSYIKGLIHVIRPASDTVGKVIIDCPVPITGAIVADGAVEVDDAQIAADPSLFSSPPIGYRAGTNLLPVSGTWKWEPAP